MCHEYALFYGQDVGQRAVGSLEHGKAIARYPL